MKIIYIDSPKYGLHEAFVDDEDYDYLMQWKWGLKKDPSSFYVARNQTCPSSNLRITVRMHRVVLNAIEKEVIIDHIDHNGLNNQKYNLRSCTKGDNNKNRRAKKGGTSKYIGVFWKTKNKKWGSDIKVNGKKIYLGIFAVEEDAARAYDKAATGYHGEFANLNFKE